MTNIEERRTKPIITSKEIPLEHPNVKKRKRFLRRETILSMVFQSGETMLSSLSEADIREILSI